MHVVKRTYRFPFIGQATNELSGTSLPGGPGGGAWAFISNTQVVAPDSGAPSIDKSSQRVSVPRAGLLGISIAPDSAIATCDIWIQTNGVDKWHRISPGNPIAGLDIESDVIMISVPTLPAILATTVNQYCWDGIKMRDPLGAADVWAYPLSLYFWYDSMPAFDVKRSLYHARALVRVAANQTGSLLVVTDGRTRVELITSGLSTTATYTVFGWQPRGTQAQTMEGATQYTLIASKVCSNGVTKDVINLATVGNVGLVQVNLTDSTGAQDNWLDVYAYD